MVSKHVPEIKVTGNIKIPIISSDVPEPVSYTGRNFIELKFSPRILLQCKDNFLKVRIHQQAEQPMSLRTLSLSYHILN
jgi:hypothetical protein